MQHGASAQAQFAVTVVNGAPSASLSWNGPVYEGSTFVLTAVGHDSSADMAAGLLYSFNCGSGWGAYGTRSTATCAASPDETTRNVGARVKDKDNAISESTASVAVQNAAPPVTMVSPAPNAQFAIGQFVTIRAHSETRASATSTRARSTSATAGR